jgi:hypothetical protein
MAILAQYNASRIAGFKDRILIAPHTPHPLRRSTLEEFHSKNEDIVMNNIKFPFRNMKQYAPAVLANHLELEAGTAILSTANDYELLFLSREAPEKIDRVLSRIEKEAPRILCVQGLEVADARCQARIEAVLKR